MYLNFDGNCREAMTFYGKCRNRSAPLPLQQREVGLVGAVPPHGVAEKLQRIAALHDTGPGDGEQAGGGYLAVDALVPE